MSQMTSINYKKIGRYDKFKKSLNLHLFVCIRLFEPIPITYYKLINIQLFLRDGKLTALSRSPY
jgi:hypothetical protein